MAGIRVRVAHRWRRRWPPQCAAAAQAWRGHVYGFSPAYWNAGSRMCWLMRGILDGPSKKLLSCRAEAVQAGASRREAAERFEISASAAVKWLQRWRDHGVAIKKPPKRAAATRNPPLARAT